MRKEGGFAHILILLLLLAGLAAGVYLVTQKTNFFSRASNPPIVFKTVDGKPLPVTITGVTQTTSSTVKVELTSPFGPPASTTNPVSGPNPTGTVAYRTALDPVMLNAAPFTPYLTEPTTYTVGFKNTSGTQFYWVEFKSSDGRLDRRSAQIEVVSGGPISQPITSTPQPPQSSSRVFVTSTAYNGNLGGLAGADAKCQERANAANLGGTWKAWLSTQKSEVQSRLIHSTGEYRRLDGVVVANNWADIFDNGGFRNPLNVTELKTQKDTGVWTGAYFRNDRPPYVYGPSTSTFDGSSSCGNWMSAVAAGSPGYDGYIGVSGSTGRQSIGLGTIRFCYNTTVASLYCFEQDSAVSTPTPTVTAGFVNLSSQLNNNTATFNFTSNGVTGPYKIDMSTLKDMSWDVYLDFAGGSSSPVTLSNPLTRWAKYACNSTLYWRVLSADRKIQSPIQTATITCGTSVGGGGFSNLSATLNNDKATFNFTSTSISGPYRIDMSTLKDMSWDVYVNFGYGTSSPVTVSSPQSRWAKYSCGQTLYWKVLDYSRKNQSSIQATTIVCPVTKSTNSTTSVSSKTTPKTLSPVTSPIVVPTCSFAQAAGIYGSSKGSRNYMASCDTNNDGRINIYDIITLLRRR